MLRVAVVGLGGIGKTHTRCYTENPNATLVALCDLQPERVDPVAEQYGLPAYHSIDKLLAAEQIDAVSVATAGPENGGHHYEPAMQLIEAGKHVLVEKPISNDIESRPGHGRVSPRNAACCSASTSTTASPRPPNGPRSCRTTASWETCCSSTWPCGSTIPTRARPWFHLRALHPHSIDVMRYFGGTDHARCRRSCTRGRAAASGPTPRSTSSSRAVRSGISPVATTRAGTIPIERCEVAGSKGRFVIENVFQRLEFFPRESPEKLVVDNPIMGGMEGFGQTFTRRIDRFVEQVSAGGPLDASGADGLAAQEVIEAAIRSFEGNSVEEVAG